MEQRGQPDATADRRPRGGEDPDGERHDEDEVPEAPAAGVLFPDMDDPPEPNEPG